MAPLTLAEAIAARIVGDVDASVRARAEYSTDASNYRVPPQVVVFPKNDDDVAAVLEICRERGVALTSRGGGTSVAGNAVGPGVVLDFSRHMNKILEIDPVARTARVQPGVVMSDLQAAAAVHGLRFGPDPSTQNRATLGGMIGNNACGPHAVAWGRTADNVLALECIDGAGRAFTAGSGSLGKGSWASA
ncbi:FAD-binding oxidoreductase [Trueperella pyogenes]|uniref:FAD-binding oxidoreductase n=1 Tax=Trueperella pyogenes TaxID=1661 RepID=UPI0031331488